MKTKQLFFCSLTGLALLTTSCSSNDEALNGGNGASNDGNTYAQIAISVANSATTRAVTGNTGDEAYGDDAEYTVNDLTVVLANENDIAMQVITPKMKTATNTDAADDKLIRVTEPFKCTPGSYKVYVLANYKNSQDALTPIIKGSTDMKAEFGITKIAKLSTTDEFFMTNVSAPEAQEIKTDATDKEVDDAGTEITGGKTNLNLLKVDVERAVSKVTFDNTDNQSFDVMVGDNKIATATLEGASLINLNKKMYLVKGGRTATNKPAGVTDEWPYPMDPNYSQTSIDAAYCETNFEQSIAKVFPAPSTATFYCPENTMEASAQLNGQTTGVVYKVKYAPEAAYYTELAAENGTDSYSQMFAKVLNLADKDEAITDKIFTEATTADKADGTFYSYNGYVFKTKAGARLYKAIATANTGDDAKAVNAAFKANENDDDIQTYKEGYCYYTAWIKHNPTSTVTMQQDKYGVVRNFWYELKVNSIKKLGYSKPKYKNPTDPDDKAEASIQVQVKIKKWRLVKQNVDLE
jgi:hypothetical protein